MSQWYYAVNGQRSGPISKPELQALIASSTVAPADLVWTQGMPQWAPAADVFPTALPYASSPTYPSPIPDAILTPPPPDQPLGYFNPTGHVTINYASFWARVGALIIDRAIMWLVGLTLGYAANVFISLASVGGADRNAYFVLTSLLGYVIAWLYDAYMLSTYGQTWGKMALAIRIIRSDGRPLTFARATGRHFGTYVSALLLGIGYLMAAFTRNKQTLHDLMADTIAVRYDATTANVRGFSV